MKTSSIFLFLLLFAQLARAQSKAQPEGCTIILSADTVEIVGADFVMDFDVFVVRSLKTKRCGYMDSEANWILPPLYDSLEDYSTFMDDNEERVQYSEAQKGGKWGFLQGATREATPFLYEAVNVQGITNAFLLAKYEGKWGTLNPQDLKSWQIPAQFDTITGDHTMNEEGRYRAQKAGKWGIIDGKGEALLPLRFDKLDRISDTLFRVCEGDSCYLLGNTYQRLCPCKYEIDAAHWSDAKPPFEYKEGKFYGLIDEKCQPITAAIYRSSFFFIEGRACVQDRKTKRWGYIDETGKWIVEPKFKEIGYRRIEVDGVDGVSARLKGRKYGVIDSEGKWLLSPRWYAAPSFGWSATLSPVKHSPRKYSYVDTKTFSRVLKENYSETWNFYEGIALVKKGRKWGIIDKKGDWLINAQFKERPSVDEKRRLMTIFWKGKWQMAKF